MAEKSSTAVAVKDASNSHVPRFSFPKAIRLRKRGQYQHVARSAKRLAGRWIAIDALSKGQYPTRLGILVTKKFGDAVERNRFKRIVREAFRLIRHTLPEGLDIVVKPRTDSLKATTQDIQDEFMKLLRIKN